jgi:hypothetical protein
MGKPNSTTMGTRITTSICQYNLPFFPFVVRLFSVKYGKADVFYPEICDDPKTGGLDFMQEAVESH